MVPITGDGNGKGRRRGAVIFGGRGGEAAPRCGRRTAQRRAVRQPRRLKAVMTGVWSRRRSKEIGPVGRAGEKNMVKSMRCVRKIGEGILVDQNRKKIKIKTVKDFCAINFLKFD
jgi:hypothetical protein